MLLLLVNLQQWENEGSCDHFNERKGHVCSTRLTPRNNTEEQWMQMRHCPSGIIWTVLKNGKPPHPIFASFLLGFVLLLHSFLSSTYCGRMTHICVSKLTTIGSDNGLPPRRQAIISTNGEILSIGCLGTTLSAILIAIHTFSFKKMHLKIIQFGLWIWLDNATYFHINAAVS